MSGPHASAEPDLVELIGQLAQPDRLERVHAAARLVHLGRRGWPVEDALIRALGDERAVVRKLAALVLGDLAPQARGAVPALVQALHDPDAGVRRRAAVALGQFGAEAAAAIPALRSALGDDDEGVRSLAATTLAVISPPARPKAA